MRTDPQRAARITGALAFVCVLASTGSAIAYCRTTTCNPGDPKQQCDRDSSGCMLSGHPLYWPDACVSFSVQKDGSQTDGISYDLANQLIGAGFYTWMHATCEPGASGPVGPSVTFMTTPAVSCAKVEYNKKEPNANIWMFRDRTWPYGAGATLALTTVTFNVETGEIYDADVEINSAQNVLTTGTPVTDDLLSIVTHEAGHFLGLAHSPVEAATMYASYKPTSTGLRSLDADDISAVCDIYPPTRSIGLCNAEPRHGFSPTCNVPPDDSGCRAAGPGRSGSGSALQVIAALAGCLVARALRRSRGRRRDGS